MRVRIRPSSIAILAALASCRSGQGRPAEPEPTPAVPALSLQALDDLLNTPNAPAITGTTSVDSYRATIRDRLARPEFYEAFAPAMISLLDVPQGGRPIVMTDLLKRATGKDGKPYMFVPRIGDCGGTDTVAVRPWWALDHEVSVCRSSVRAEVSTIADGTYCEASVFTMEDCGCGPNLVMCTPSPKWRSEAAKQARAEVRLTLRHIVVNKLPYSAMLTLKDTVRSSFGDFWYARAAFWQGQPLAMPRVATDDLQLIPASTTDFELRPRRPEHRGGFLTTPLFLLTDGSRRVSVQNLWNDFLCVDWSSTTIDAHRLVELTTETNDIRVDANHKLIDTPGCRDCHTRLEYPVLALDEFTNFFKGSRYVPRAKPVTTKLYVKGADDMRAEFTADAYELGRHMAEQPEFASCAVSKVLDFVYQGYSVPEDTRALLLAQFRRGQDLGRLVEDALIARIFGLAPAEASP